MAIGRALWLFPLSVHVCQYHGDVGGEQVVHLVSEARLAEQPAASNQTTDGDVEVVWSAAPVGDLREWVGCENFLKENKTMRVKTSFINWFNIHNTSTTIILEQLMVSRLRLVLSTWSCMVRVPPVTGLFFFLFPLVKPCSTHSVLYPSNEEVSLRRGGVSSEGM